jgi:DNA helicase-2/ATP-dependent DNA helicase PcrA
MIRMCGGQRNRPAMARDTDYLDLLNPEQRRAVAYGVDGSGANISGPLLIIAGAGTGKTSTLAHRVAHLIVHGADPARILLLTFSRRAAVEMERRVARILASVLGVNGRNPMQWSGTFHAVAARLLRSNARSIGLDPSFTIHDREDSADLMNLVRHELGLSDKRQRFPLKATCLAIYSRAVNAGEALALVLKRHFPWCTEWQEELRGLFAAYVAAKQQQQVLDYDDLLLYWAELMQVSELAGALSAQFDYVMVDEYQDTNALQATILRRLKPDGAGLTVVGDDAQAIYAFRAATVRNILDFPRQFTPAAEIVRLEQNYRSTQPILAACNAVIALASEHFVKTLRSARNAGEKPSLVSVLDDLAQARFVADGILENREGGMALKDQAVLFRTSHHSAVLEIELNRRNIPFVKFGGLRFLEAAHVKDMLAVLRWAENPCDRVAGFRVVQLLDGIGPATAGKILEQMQGGSPIAGLAALAPPPRAGGWSELVALMQLLAPHRSDWPGELDAVRRWYQPLLEQRYADATIRAGDLEQLQRIAAGYPSRGKFLTDIALDPPGATSDEAGVPLRDEDYLVLSTIHSAKGQEWRAVYVLNVVDGCIPSDMATGSTEEIDEERRLLYVGMTRAKDRLALVLPQRFYTHGQPRSGDRHVYAARTRFIPGAIVEAFQCRSWPVVRGLTEPAQRAGANVDLSARVRAMWRA